MPDNITCPGCQRRLRLPESLSSQTVVCPVCGLNFQASEIPVATAPVAIPPAIPMAKVEEIPLRPEWDQPARPASAPSPARPNLLADLAKMGASQPKKPPTGLRRPTVMLALGITLFTLVGAMCAGWRPWEKGSSVRSSGPLISLDDDDFAPKVANLKPLAPDEIADDVTPFLRELGDAYRDHDHRRIARHFDPSRMLDELLAQEILPPDFVRDRPTVVRILNNLPGRGLERQVQLFEWTDFEIRSIKQLDNLDAVVIARHTGDNGAVVGKMRWWLSRRTGDWKVYDVENIDVCLRFSVLAASGTNLGPVQESTQAIIPLADAIEAVGAQNPGLAEQKLQQLARSKLPAKLEPVRLMAAGAAQIERGEFKESLQTFDEAARLQPDMHALDLLRGIAYNALGQWENARKPLQAYRDLLGDDPIACRQLGLAFRGVKQWASAAESYRRALDLEPKSAEAFRGLLNSLERGAARGDIAERFLKIEDPRGHFEEFAAESRENRDGESLEQLALAMKQLDRDYPPTDFYHALALVWRGQSGQATAPLRRVLAREKDPHTRRDFLHAYLKAMLDANQPVEAYAAAPNATEAFAILGAELKKRFRPDQLKELVTLHAKEHPGDPLLPFYRGELLVRDSQYERAEKEFAAGLAKLNDPDTLALFRSSRVSARYHIGQAVAAYQEISPREETFDQLATLCFMDRNYPMLQTLLDLHSKNVPETFEVLRTRARLKIKQQQIAEGIAAFKSAMAKLVPKDQRERFVNEFLRDMVEAGQSLQAYDAAPEPLAALRILAEQLHDCGKRAELQALIDLHRKHHPEDAWTAFYTGELHLDERAWDKAAMAFREAFEQDANENRFRSNYVYAMYRAGQGLKAYRQANEKHRTAIFGQLINLLATDKKAAEMESLLNLRARDSTALQSEILLYQARAKVFASKPAEAVPLFRQACEKTTGDIALRQYIWEFMNDMYQAGLPLEGYRASPDKFAAFEAMARRCVTDKKAEWLESLLAEHAPGRADDPWVCLYTGELYLLRNDAAKAEPEFAAALAKTPVADNWQMRNGLNRARIRAGKVVIAYQEAGANQRAFNDLANQCQWEKNPRQLEALIAAHRQAHPDDDSLRLWDLELVWLRQDYDGVVKMLAEHPDWFASPGSSWKAADYQVRSLVKLKRTKEAIEKAESLHKDRRGNTTLLVLAYAADGHVKQTMAALERELPHRYLIDLCYHDNDLGPILRSDAFREFRQRFPEPDSRRPDDDDD